MPQMTATIEEHVKRAVYQGGHVCGQMLMSTPELPSPDGAGPRHLRATMHPSGHAYQMQASPAMNLSPVNVRRVLLGSASAKKLP